MVLVRRAPPCSSLLTAGGGLGHARIVFRRRVLFSFFRRSIQASIRMYRYIPITVYVYKKHNVVAGRSLPVPSEDQWFESRVALFFCVPISLFLVGAMYFVPM